MKNLKLFIFSAAVLMLASCSKEMVETTAVGTQKMVVTAWMPESGTATKVSVTEDESDATKSWKIQWNKGDVIGAWWSGRTLFSEFSMNTFTDADGKTATFTGEAPASGTVQFVFPYKESNITSSEYEMPLGSQVLDYNTPFANLASYDYMLSEAVTPLVSSYETGADLKFHHLVAMVDLQLKFSNVPAGNPKIVGITIMNGNGSETVNIPSVSKINLSDGTKATTSGDIALILQNAPTIQSGTVYSFPFSIFPITIAQSKSVSIQVRTINDSGDKRYYNTTITNSNASDLSVSAGYHYSFKKTVDLNTATGSLSSWLGSGTIGDPYQIYTKAELISLASNVNDGNSYTDTYFHLMNDVNLEGRSDSQWTPVGTSAHPFKGNFDGGNHRISGIYISNGNNYQGLFGYTKDAASIKNLTVEGTVTGSTYVGLLVGMANGASANRHYIENCHSYGSVSGTGTSNTNNGIGGLVGFEQYGTMNGCSNRAAVSGIYRVGGIAGSSDNASVIINSANYGSVNADGTSYSYVAGIAGNAATNCKVVNCVNFGAVSSSTNTSNYWGTVVGNAYGSGTKVINCYNAGTITKNGSGTPCAVSGLQSASIENSYYLANAVVSTQDGATSLSDAVMKGTGTIGSGTYSEKTFIEALNAGAASYNSYYSPDISACSWAISATYPVLSPGVLPSSAPATNWIDVASPNLGGGAGTQGNPYLITSGYELAHLAKIVNDRNTQTGVYFKLTNDIDLEGYEWTPIGYYGSSSDVREFCGTFDGCGHTIKGLYYYDEKGYAGLFGVAGNAAVIKNVRVSGSITATGNEVTVGGICGYCNGKIINCSFSGYAESFSNTGGIVGHGFSPGATIINCYNEGTVVSTGTSAQTAGGIIGYMVSGKGNVNNCYNVGLVKVPALSSAGGISGHISVSKVTNCYYLEGNCFKGSELSDAAVQGESDVEGERKTSSEMISSDFLNTLNTNANTLRTGGETNICNWTTGSTYPVHKY